MGNQPSIDSKSLTMKGKTLRVVALQFCDDINVYGGSKKDLQHNVGIVAEWVPSDTDETERPQELLHDDGSDGRD